MHFCVGKCNVGGSGTGLETDTKIVLKIMHGLWFLLSIQSLPDYGVATVANLFLFST